VRFSNATDNGGAMNYQQNVRISFKGNSSITFTHYTVKYGGAIRSSWDTIILFTDSSTTNFIKNILVEACILKGVI